MNTTQSNREAKMLKKIQTFVSDKVNDTRDNEKAWEASPDFSAKWRAKKWAFLAVNNFIRNLEAEN